MNNPMIVGAIAFAFCVAPAMGQSSSVLATGKRVRISAPTLDPSQQIGRVTSATADSIEFRSDAQPYTRAIAIADLTSLDVSGGQRTHRGRDAGYGSLIGAVVGGVAGAASYKDPGPGCFIFCETRGEDTVAGAIVGGVTGALIGWFIVGSFDKSERWVPLRSPTKVSISPASRGVALRLSRAF